MKNFMRLIAVCAFASVAQASPLASSPGWDDYLFSAAGLSDDVFLSSSEAPLSGGDKAQPAQLLTQVAMPGATSVLRVPVAKVGAPLDYAFLTGAQAYASEPLCVTPQLELPGTLLGEMVKHNQTQQRHYMTYIQDKFRVPAELSRRIVSSAYSEAQSTGLPPQLLLAVMERESGFRPQIRSSAGAVGLMQVMGKYHGHKLDRPGLDLTHPETNIKLGALVLKEYLEKTNGNMQNALSSYSGGARAYASKVLGTYRELKERLFGQAESARRR